MTDKCRFCDYIQNKNVNRRIDVPWHQNEDYVAFISQGAILKGWTVIFPKKHQLNMLKHYESDKFWSFVKEVNAKLSSIFGDCIFFEHGSFNESSLMSCGTYHAHVHLVPANIDLKQAAKAFDRSMDWSEISVLNLPQITDEYLLMSNSVPAKASRVEIAYPDTVTSQFFRQVIATELGAPELYNYRVDQFIENAEESLNLLDSFEECVLID